MANESTCSNAFKSCNFSAFKDVQLEALKLDRSW